MGLDDRDTVHDLGLTGIRQVRCAGKACERRHTRA